MLWMNPNFVQGKDEGLSLYDKSSFIMLREPAPHWSKAQTCCQLERVAKWNRYSWEDASVYYDYENPGAEWFAQISCGSVKQGRKRLKMGCVYTGLEGWDSLRESRVFSVARYQSLGETEKEKMSAAGKRIILSCGGLRMHMEEFEFKSWDWEQSGVLFYSL